MMRRKAGPATDIDARALPHNLEAEQAVLGSILLHNDAYLVAAQQLGARDFFRDAHRILFESMARILDNPAGAVDLVTLKDDLLRQGQLDAVGGPAYIAALVDGLPRSTNVAHYATIVRDKALLRRLIQVGNRIVTDAYCAEEPATALVLAADRAIVGLQNGAHSDRMRSTAETSQALYETLEYRHAHKGELSGVDTGFASINALTGGWQVGDMVVIASRPSIGKTTFVINSAMAAAALGKRVAIFSLEMRRQQLEFRVLASLSGVPLSVLLGGWVNRPEDWQALTLAIERLHEAPIYIDDTASRTVSQIRAEARRLQADKGLDLIVIDYVQLMASETERHAGNRNAEITEISRRLKLLADELHTPVLVVSQLNRAGEIRSDPRPKLSDLRESGALEQDADVVCFLHRRHHRESGTTNFILEKQRNGPTGTVNLTIQRELTRFIDGGEDEAPSEAERKADERDSRARSIARSRAENR